MSQKWKAWTANALVCFMAAYILMWLIDSGRIEIGIWATVSLIVMALVSWLISMLTYQ